MIGQVIRVWPARTRTTVIVKDDADGREKACYVWLNTTKGQLIASLCQRHERDAHGRDGAKIVLTVKPKHPYYGYQIEHAEAVTP